MDASQASVPPESGGASAPSTDQLIALLRQERADFRNYQKRVASDKQAELERLRADLLALMLPLIDELDRALADVPDHLRDDPWVRGITLTRSRLEELEQQLGIERFGEVGDRFDPSRHEAVSYEPDPEAADANLLRIIRPGYASAGRLLRPARVVVRGPAPSDGSVATPDQEQVPPDNEESRG